MNKVYIRNSSSQWIDICNCKKRLSTSNWSSTIKLSDKIRDENSNWQEVLCEIPCGSPTQYNGGVGFPSTLFLNLGTATGTVLFNFFAGSIPDKFIVTFDGAEVINTGYVGDPSTYQTLLNTALIAKGLPTETIIDSDGHGFGNGTAQFSKTTVTQTVRVDIYSPLPDTGWFFTLQCPTTQTIYHSAPQQITVQKNNCPSGRTGSMVQVNNNANVFTSLVSQSAANQLSLDKLNRDGQSYANSKGTCS